MSQPIYPVTVSMSSKLSKKLGHEEAVRIRKELEAHLNERAKDSRATVFFYNDVASKINTTTKTVEDILRRSGGGSGGITIYNHQIQDQ